MKIGLIGLNQTGKTTLFNLLTGKDETGNSIGGKNTATIGTCTVPDERVDFLSEVYKPKKTTYAKIELTDIAGFSPSDDSRSSGASKFLNDVRPCNALVYVLRAFDSTAAAHLSETIDPARDLEAIETEMLFADLESIERRIERIKAGKKITKEHEAEIALLQRCFEWMEKGNSILDMDLSDQERISIRSFTLLTEKPRLAVVNVDENRWRTKNWPNQDALRLMCESFNIPLLELCVDMELEISRLPEEDKQIFMADMNINQPGTATLAQSVYKLLNLISFLTYGADEVRAWTINEGTAAKTAAGKIHTDIERGFIRAEVVKYQDFYELSTMAKVKEKGLFRLEGKEYVVEDGDIITFRFNV